MAIILTCNSRLSSGLIRLFKGSKTSTSCKLEVLITCFAARDLTFVNQYLVVIWKVMKDPLPVVDVFRRFGSAIATGGFAQIKWDTTIAGSALINAFHAALALASALSALRESVVRSCEENGKA